MIEARDLTKRFGDKVAVDHLSFTVQPGRVTGFLGPNGAGKSTTMRMIVGLDHPNSGSADDQRQARMPSWSTRCASVGALLEAKSVHSGRSARNHLLFLAQTQGLPASRVDAMLDLVGLGEVAGKRAGGFSLGMSQRLGVAAALLGDPQVLLLDEPVNGLDPEGVLWIRNLMKHLASAGQDGAGVQPPDERDGRHGRPPDRDRPGQAARRRRDRGGHRPGLRPVGASRGRRTRTA